MSLIEGRESLSRLANAGDFMRIKGFLAHGPRWLWQEHQQFVGGHGRQKVVDCGVAMAILSVSDCQTSDGRILLFFIVRGSYSLYS